MRTATLLLLGVLLVPLVGPVAAAFSALTPAFAEWDRLAQLATNSVALAAIACLVAVPAGAFAALALERLPFRGSGLVRCLVVAALFVPLPVTAVAWQVILGSWAALAPGEIAWRPWSQGLLPAGVVHGVAGWPWVVVIVAEALRRTDSRLEEDALGCGGPATLFRRVLWPRILLGSFAGGAWVTLQTLTEIAVTDAMMVRTFAEEVYTQLVGASDGVGATLAVTAPPWLLTLVVSLVVARRTVARLAEPPGEAGPAPVAAWPAWCRGACAAGLVALLAAFVVLPVTALIWTAGGGASRGGWSLDAFAGECVKVARTDGRVLASSWAEGVAVGVVAVSLALVAAWAATRSKAVLAGVVAVGVVLAVTPGPVVGSGLKQAIGVVVEMEAAAWERLGVAPDFPPLRSALYDQPSPLPAIWACVTRFFPLALAIVIPALFAVPREFREAARLDGLTVWEEWRRVTWPAARSAAFVAVVAVTALSLGEVSASKLVNPPSRSAFVLRLFDQMHYGAETTVAALALMPLIPALLMAVAVSGRVRR